MGDTLLRKLKSYILKIPRWARLSCLTLVISLLSLASYAGALQLAGNVHSVMDGVLYRAAQPSEQTIRRLHDTYGIRTIINLRGPQANKTWYKKEVAATKSLGIRHIDFRMSAGQELSQTKAEEMIEILRSSPKPILIHCRSGSDRTGLAAALFLAAVAGKGEARAEGQLSFYYGHVAIPYLSEAFAMDQTFENLEPWLGFPDS